MSELLAELLSDRFVVHRASTGAEAVHIFGHSDVGVVVTDQYLPDTTGTELAKAFKASRRHVRVVLVTGDARGAGVEVFDAVLEKPYPPERLLDLLGRLCDGRAKVEQREGSR